MSPSVSKHRQVSQQNRSSKTNGEGYLDPTASIVEKKETSANLKEMMRAIRILAKGYGYTIENRIIFRDDISGEIFK